jgi:hypothetical protein
MGPAITITCYGRIRLVANGASSIKQFASRTFAPTTHKPAAQLVRTRTVRVVGIKTGRPCRFNIATAQISNKASTKSQINKISLQKHLDIATGFCQTHSTVAQHELHKFTFCNLIAVAFPSKHWRAAVATGRLLTAPAQHSGSHSVPHQITDICHPPDSRLQSVNCLMSRQPCTTFNGTGSTTV